MAAAASDGITVATDLAEQLVLEGMPFRHAHAEVAARVAAGERFDSPTAAEAASGRQSLQALHDQLRRARTAVTDG
jgi:argininosuccinate lyase